MCHGVHVCVHACVRTCVHMRMCVYACACILSLSLSLSLSVCVYVFPLSYTLYKELNLIIAYRFTPEERAKQPQLAHMPFGFVPRSCIGMRFALLEAKTALLEVLKRYTFVRAPDTQVMHYCNAFFCKYL